MKWNYTKYVGLLILIVSLSAGCEEQHKIKPATYTLLLTGEESKSWTQSSFTFYFDDENEPPYNANLIYGVPSCDQDNVFKFYRKAKQIELYTGDTWCEEDDQDLIFRTSWDVINANATFIIGGGEYVLEKLTEDSLVYGFRDTLAIEIYPNTLWEFPGIATWVYLAN